MPEPSLAVFAIVTVFALAFAFTNGLNDAANAIATVVGTRVLSPRHAVTVAALCNFAGAATGTAVAATIGKGIIAPDVMTEGILLASLASIIIWGLFCTRVGLPISLTHGLVAGLVGAGLAELGSSPIQWHAVQRILLAVITAPALGFVAGFAVMIVLTWIFRRSSPASMRSIFGTLQIFSTAFVAYSHGKNDGQMPIGVITAGLVYYSGNTALWDRIPWWIIVVSAGAITLGTALGGWKVVRTLGLKVTDLRPVHGFAAQSAGAAVIEAASQFGIPVSTTHCVTASVMGVGASRRFSAVRWKMAWNIVAVWVLTFPACLVLGWLLGWLFQLVT